ncbi:hypothetical protein ACWCOV_21845 [Kribbella sp. NPDC002412]
MLPDLTATQVVSALKTDGYNCSTDVAYAVCRMGATSIGVLTGDHPRPPVVSVQASGQVDVAWAEISNSLPRILELAHINQPEIATWFNQQKGKPVAQQSFGDWLVDVSAEVDTEEPGVHLTLTDKLCKTNCQAE